MTTPTPDDLIAVMERIDGLYKALDNPEQAYPNVWNPLEHAYDELEGALRTAWPTIRAALSNQPSQTSGWENAVNKIEEIVENGLLGFSGSGVRSSLLSIREVIRRTKGADDE